MKITFFGTTTLLFDDGKDQILFDAHVTRPSVIKYFFGFKIKTNNKLCDALIKQHGINRLRAIFISHTHYDHSMDAPYFANKCNTTVYGSKSARNIALGGNVPEDRIVIFKPQDTFTIGDYKIRVLKSLHSTPTPLNNDIGVEISKPLIQPARLRKYTEGGSYDFVIEHKGKTYVIRPSFNWIEGQFNNIIADVLFLGVAGLANAKPQEEIAFFNETADKIQPKLIIPLHWDNFFVPLTKPTKKMLWFVESTREVFHRLGKYCENNQINYIIQYPCTSIEI